MAKKRQNSALPQFLMIAGGALLIIAVVIWRVIALNQSPTPPVPAENPTQASIPYPEAARISLTNAKAAFEAGTAVFVDVRDTDSYTARHIPGALHIPLADLPSRLIELDPSAQIITYCT